MDREKDMEKLGKYLYLVHHSSILLAEETRRLR
jgi:hypothetical protein